MPKKLENNLVVADKSKSKKTPTAKSTRTKKSSTASKSALAKETTKSSSIQKKPSTKRATKSASTQKKASTKRTTKSTSASTTKKSSVKTTNKVSSTSKSNATTKRKNSTKAFKKTNNVEAMEYYSLPNTYNQTTVKVLFQTPKRLFVYWEISEDDKNKLIAENGSNFFEITSPYLIVKNITKNYSFEVMINDFANSWYFDIPDSNCEYTVDLVRKLHYTHNTVFIISSNELEVPNNHILFEQNRKEVFFKNVKTNNVFSKSIVNLQFINYLGHAYPAYKVFYQKFYKEEDLLELNNPSSL